MFSSLSDDRITFVAFFLDLEEPEVRLQDVEI